MCGLLGGTKRGKSEYSKVSTKSIRDDIVALVFRFSSVELNMKTIEEVKTAAEHILKSTDKNVLTTLLASQSIPNLRRLSTEVLASGTRPVVRFRSISEIVFNNYINQLGDMSSLASKAEDLLCYLVQYVLLMECGDETGGVSWKTFLTVVSSEIEKRASATTPVAMNM